MQIAAGGRERPPRKSDGSSAAPYVLIAGNTKPLRFSGSQTSPPRGLPDRFARQKGRWKGSIEVFKSDSQNTRNALRYVRRR